MLYEVRVSFRSDQNKQMSNNRASLKVSFPLAIK
jgi:hypothetical protein